MRSRAELKAKHHAEMYLRRVAQHRRQSVTILMRPGKNDPGSHHAHSRENSRRLQQAARRA